MPANIQNEILKPASIRHNNYRSILLTIMELGTCTVANIAEHLNLSKTAIAKAVTALIEQGFIESIGKTGSSAIGGKPAEQYRLNPNCRFTCSISYYHDLIVVRINNFIGESIVQASYPSLSAVKANMDSLLDAASEWISKSFALCKEDVHKLCGIVFQYSTDDAVADSVSAVLKEYADNPEFRQRLVERLEIPNLVYSVNAKDMRGYAELHSDRSRYERTIVVVSILKDAVTGCILDHGKVMHGKDGLVGNFAHIPTDDYKRHVCTCGNRGCFSSVILRNALLKDISIELKAGAESVLQDHYKQNKLSMIDVVDACEAGDELANRYMGLNLDNYTRLIYIIYLTLNPGEIIFQVGPYAVEFHRKELNRRFEEVLLPVTTSQEPVRISVSDYEPFQATGIGSADYCIDNFLNNPNCFDL